MKKYSYFIGVVAVLGLLGVAKASSNGTASPQVVRLEKKNTLVMRQVFTEDSVSAVQQAALQLSAAAGASDTIYLYLDTPGGSIVDGSHLINTLKALPQEVKTITSFSASMGFITAESLGERLSLPDGVYMSHRAKIGLQGQIPGEINTRLHFWENATSDIETTMATRLGLTLPAYQNLIREEYWVSGEEAVKAKVADKVVLVSCAQDLSGTTDTTIQTMFGPIKVTYSDCPLISAPLAISFGALEGPANDVENVRRVVYEVLTNKYDFADNIFLQSEYAKYVK